MATLLVFEFPMEGPWGDEMAAAFSGLAEDIAGETGLIWKVWTEAPERKTGGIARRDDPKKLAAVVRPTKTTDTIKKLLSERAAADR